MHDCCETGCAAVQYESTAAPPVDAVHVTERVCVPAELHVSQLPVVHVYVTGAVVIVALVLTPARDVDKETPLLGY